MADRDETGKFVKGHPGGPGRPKKEREQRFMEITLSTVSFSDWREIVLKAVQLAKRGDAIARKFLADYIIGPPIQRNEVTGADGDRLKLEIEYVNSPYPAATVPPGSDNDTQEPGEV